VRSRPRPGRAWWPTASRSSKEELLRTLCTDGLVIVIGETEAAIERIRAGQDRWAVFTDFMHRLADADTSSMTRALAGKFVPTPEMFTLANRSSELMETFFGLIRGTLRPGVVTHDVSLVFELVAAIKFSSPERTTELRHRYLTVILDGLRAGHGDDLPGPPPAWQELTERWVPAN
jgi:hypothetical protein